VESALGAGTIIRIYLPASAGTVVKKDVKREELVKGAGRILVMDDDEILREATRKMLTTLGYEAELAQEGAEAIGAYQKARESGRPFDAVIMDLTVPGGMGGKEAVKKLLEIDPNARAIVSSGYSNDPVMAEFAKYGFRGIMIKPYRMKDLSEVMRQVIKMES
jgi:DNA-binding NtrC family response regulator